MRLQRVSSPVGNSLRMTSWKSGCGLLCVGHYNKTEMFAFFLINKFVLIYIPGDGKASHPLMKVVTLKLAFEVLVLLCV